MNPPETLNGNAVIRIENVRKVYNTGEVELRALDGVNLDVRRGEFVAMMGPSGSGKSTLMNILGALDHPSDGRYFLEDEDVGEMEQEDLADLRNRRIGFIFQSFNLLQRMTALQNVTLPMLYRVENRVGHATREEIAIAALESVGLGDRLYHRPNQLSGGQQQRVAIARALVNRPSLMLADEPTGNLDSKSSEEIMGILQNLNRQGVTIVMVTHEADIAKHARRVVCMRDGKIVSDGRAGAQNCLERKR
ncbi:MAG: ABC transporter ATP-binding protein [Chloroflexi bacterium]|nr:ABC transporter ATP-binding protein [Chloroflexota bacterium]